MSAEAMSNPSSDPIDLPSPNIRRRETAIAIPDINHAARDIQLTNETSKHTSIDRPDDLNFIRDQIIVDHRQLVDHAVSALGRAIHIGELARKAKSILPHGQFTSWVASQLTAQCNITLRTVQRYMQLSKRSGELFDAIRHRLEKEQAAPVTIENVERTVCEMKIDDALSILRTKKSTGLAKRKGPRNIAAETEVIGLLEYLATKFFAGVSDSFDRPPPDQIKATSSVCANTFVVPTDSRSVEQLVTDCIEVAEDDKTSAVLLYLSGQCADRHSWRLDRFIRVHIRQEKTLARKNCILFGLISEHLQPVFNQAFHQCGVVLIPYPGDSNPVSPDVKSPESEMNE